MCKIIAIANQKGGVSKTTTCVNLGVALAMKGQRVCVVDSDPQGNLTQSLGYRNQDEMDETLADLLKEVIEPRDNLSRGFGAAGRDMYSKPCDKLSRGCRGTDNPDDKLSRGCVEQAEDEEIAGALDIMTTREGIDLIPGNIELAGLEVSMVSLMGRETLMKELLGELRDSYDYILIDCMPSLGMLTINALVAADTVLVPVQAAYLPAKGLEQLILTISKVRRQLNRSLRIEGILLSMVDTRTNYAKEITSLIEDTYGHNIRIFKSRIPFSVRAAEASAIGVSIFAHDRKGKVAEAYRNLAEEVLENED